MPGCAPVTTSGDGQCRDHSRVRCATSNNDVSLSFERGLYLLNAGKCNNVSAIFDDWSVDGWCPIKSCDSAFIEGVKTG